MTTLTMSTPSSLETLAPLTSEQEEADLATEHIEIIETVIASLDQDQSAMVSHQDGGYLWKFSYGSVEVYVQLSGTNDNDI